MIKDFAMYNKVAEIRELNK